MNENIKKRYELFEWIDYLAQINSRVMLQIGAPEWKDWDPILVNIWLRDLEDRGLAAVVEWPQSNLESDLLNPAYEGWYVLQVDKEPFHEYVDQLYRFLQLSVEGLDSRIFLAVLDAAYDIRQKAQVTLANSVLITLKANTKRIPELAGEHDYRIDALNFLKEYGGINKFTEEGDSYSVAFERRNFDTTYRAIVTRAVHDGYADFDKRTVEGKVANEGSVEVAENGQRVSNDEILYEITYSNQEIRINGRMLSRPHFNGINDLFFDYLFNNPWKAVKVSDFLTEITKEKTLPKSVSQILNDLGFKKKFKKVFVPKSSAYKEIC